MKQSQDTDNNITLLTSELEDWFDKVYAQISKRLKQEDNFNFLFQVEEIIQDYKDDYQTILSENIQDYYIQTSETAEAKINHKLATKTLDNSILYHLANKEQSNLDDWLYKDKEDEEILKQIQKQIRFNNNIQTTLNKYLRKQGHNINLRGTFQPPEFTITELLEFEVDQAIIEYMSNNIFVASESTLSRVTQEIYDIIRESYGEQGNGTYTVTEDIMNKFTELKQYEAERIARTETLKAQGHATWKRLVNNPDCEYIQWMSTDDERTRESHVELNGEITYADGNGLFSDGLRFPGDTEGDIEEWINCRCTLVAFVPELGFVPPSGATSWFEDEMLFDTSIEIPEVYVEMDEYLASYW